ncbi:MAG: hypothetical protein ABIF77_09945 [bacterium]
MNTGKRSIAICLACSLLMGLCLAVVNLARAQDVDMTTLTTTPDLSGV